MEEIITASGLTKYFGELKAVDNIGFAVERGELFGFIGSNGAGKSTTINMLCTLYPPTQGEAFVCGYRLGVDDEEIRRHIGVVWQNNCLDERLSVKENLFVRGSLYGFHFDKLKLKVGAVCEKLHLETIINTRYALLSGGQKRRCEIAAALINTPDILFLDEPTLGLDPASRSFVWEILSKLQHEDGTTIFLTTHYMDEAARTDHVFIIDSGKVAEYGTVFALKERHARNKLCLMTKREHRNCILTLLENMYIERKNISEESGRLTVFVKDSIEALELLNAAKEHLAGFEMIQGSMDDVFLKLTGKTPN